MDIDSFSLILEELASEIPEELFKELSGGIVVSEKAKLHKKSIPENKLYVLGEYTKSKNLGRYITVYYGSYMKTYPNLSDTALKNRLRKTLRHEFLHHAESLAGEYGLEIKDKAHIDRYIEKNSKKGEE